MTIDYSQLPHEGIQQLVPYQPGKSITSLARERGLSDIIKLASNENPLGCSLAVKDALAAVSNKTIASYPSPYNHPLIKALSDHLGIASEQLLIANGSDVIFQLLLYGFALHRDKYLLTHRYAFSTYQIQAKALGIPVKFAEINPDWTVNIDQLIEASSKDCGLICLANPNNPTGQLIPAADIKKLLDNIPDTVLVVIDEAYFEYSENEQSAHAIDWLKHYPNLVLTRTFSKIYGLAGLRLGYAMANPTIIDILKRLQLPFTLSQLSLEAGLAALSDTQFIRQSLAVNQQGMQQMKQGLDKLALQYIPSYCNFISFDSGQDGSILYEHLLDKGIIVRTLHPYQMNNLIRVSIGTMTENERFLSEIGAFYS